MVHIKHDLRERRAFGEKRWGLFKIETEREREEVGFAQNGEGELWAL